MHPPAFPFGIPESVKELVKSGQERSRPVRMVLLENFGAETSYHQTKALDCDNFVRSLPTKVTQIMMPGIPKFRKESHPERAKDKMD
jgi:hypothetical protein